MGANFEHWKISEWAIPSIIAYANLHKNELKYYGQDFCSDLAKEQIATELFNYGVSIDYNKPATLEQLKRIDEDKLRLCYNSILWTNNLVDVSKVKGSDLCIVDKDKYDYICSYSFPCQDLSVAGKMAGISKDTRSGLLLQVERILDECYKANQLPQILLLENVPTLLSQSNKESFRSWCNKLESLGYTNYCDILNTTEFLIPQNRERTFMVSILGQYNFNFPSKSKLKLFLNDMLEKKVDKEYYLTVEKLKAISEWKALQDPLKDIDKEKKICPCITARGAGEEHSGMILINEKVNNNLQNISTTFDINYYTDNQIRKLSTKESFRLQGVKDIDYNKIIIHQSKRLLYHLSGDSITTTVLMAIFGSMLNIDWKTKFNEKEWWQN